MELNRENLKRLNTLYDERDDLNDKINYFSGNHKVQRTRGGYTEWVDGPELRRDPTVLLRPAKLEYIKRDIDQSTGEEYNATHYFDPMTVYKTVPEMAMILGLLSDSIIRALRKRLEEVEAEILSIK